MRRVAELTAWGKMAELLVPLLLDLSAPLVWAGLGSLVALSGRGKSLRLAQIFGFRCSERLASR